MKRYAPCASEARPISRSQGDPTQSMTTRVIAVDVGGTHARFCEAEINDGGVLLHDVVTLPTAAYPGLTDAWEAFQATRSGPRIHHAAIAVACPVDGATIKLTNSAWTFRADRLARDLGVEQLTLVNDFAALGHAVACAGPDAFVHLCGPAKSLPATGTIAICGPGTGLGVGVLHRHPLGYEIRNSEGGHQDFAPVDPFEDRLLARLRTLHGRVSVERVVSGPGIVAIREALLETHSGATDGDDRRIWQNGLTGEDSLSQAAIERFCAALGTFAGNVALDHCAHGVVIAGGVGQRLRPVLSQSDFAARFANKGRFGPILQDVPVKLIVHEYPGLLGVAAAFAKEHRGNGF